MDLQGLIDRPDVVNGHEILLHPGVYGSARLRGPGSAQDLNLRGKLLSIGSTNGSAATVIDCGGTSRLITFNNSEPRAVRLTGLTVRNCGGAADGKGAVLVTGDAAPLIGDCTFVDNVASLGAAFAAEDGARPVFERCTFVNNSAVSGCAAACTETLRSNGVCDRDACGSRQCGWDYEGRCCPETCDALWADGVCQVRVRGRGS